MKAIVLPALALSLLSSTAIAATLDGQQLFQDNCASCHGEKGEGNIGPKLVGDASDWSKNDFERAVLDGVDDEGEQLNSAMPHWKDASLKSDHGKEPTTAEVDAIQAYLQKIN